MEKARYIKKPLICQAGSAAAFAGSTAFGREQIYYRFFILTCQQKNLNPILRIDCYEHTLISVHSFFRRPPFLNDLSLNYGG
jgi:hypothetical protein